MNSYDIVEEKDGYIIYHDDKEVTEIHGPCEITFEGDGNMGDFSRVRLPDVEITRMTFGNCTVDLDYPYIPRELQVLHLNNVQLVGNFTRKMSVDRLVMDGVRITSIDAFCSFFEKLTTIVFTHEWNATACVIPNEALFLETGEPACPPEIAEVVLDEHPKLRTITLQIDTEKDLEDALALNSRLDVSRQVHNVQGNPNLCAVYKSNF